MNIAVAQSGGPTVAINASLAGVVREAQTAGMGVFGAKNGIDGVIKDEFCDLGALLNCEEEFALLRGTPSTALGSCRTKLPSAEAKQEISPKGGLCPSGGRILTTTDDEPELYRRIFENLQKREICAFFYIGGNDSMDTVNKLHDYAVATGVDIKFVGIPKTIDNDLPETDHTPGFGSAAKYLAATVKEITADSNVYDVYSVTIIEIMGRDAGWLTASTCVLADCGSEPDLIYLPEKPFDVGGFFDDIKRIHTKKKNVIVAVSEGVKNAAGDYVASSNHSGKTDVFGHKYLSGLGKFLEGEVREKIRCKVRSVELNVCQRCAAHIASETDLNEAESIGAAAVKSALLGESGVMMTIQRLSDNPYTTEYKSVDVKRCANRVRHFPEEWINADGNGIKEAARGYFLPLIQGEVAVAYKNGIPVHFRITKTIP